MGTATSVQSAAARAWRPAGMLPLPPDAAAAAEPLTVVTYNILADKYATGGMHAYCPPQFLAWPYRKQRILEELLGLRPDILALQEVGAAREADLGPQRGLVASPWPLHCDNRSPPAAHSPPSSPPLNPGPARMPLPCPPNKRPQVERPFFEAELEPLMAQHGYEALYYSRKRRCAHCSNALTRCCQFEAQHCTLPPSLAAPCPQT
jgi:hypothetical protein